MFDRLPGIVQRFGGRVWIVSKCRKRVQERTLVWFDNHRFFERTGINPAHVRFCIERPQKAAICAELGITHFVDDRMDVLEPMRGIVTERFLFGPQRHALPDNAGVRSLANWAEAAAVLGETGSE